MLKRISLLMILFIMLIHPQITFAEDHQHIEIFDPKENKVVKVIQPSKEINTMVESWLKKIDGIYAKVDPIKDDGYAVRFPLDPPIQVENKWLNTLVDEVFVIVPESDPPFFIVFEKDYNLICFPFPEDVSSLSNALDFNLRQ